MKILFLSISEFESINQHGIYPDLLRQFAKHGHEIYAVCARERRARQSTKLAKENGVELLNVKIGNITRTKIVEKGISTIMIPHQYKTAIKKYYSYIKFDLILYPTPPITLCEVVEYVKKRDGARTYLLLKDIFPQNALDIGIMKKDGLKGILYQYFRKKEKKLYQISDTIGCMSQANVEYILRHNPEIDSLKVEVCPNAIEPIEISITKKEREEIREKYGIPKDKIVFIYGGNLGKPQGIEFMLKCLHSQRKNCRAFFLIVGNGTEYPKVQHYIDTNHPKNIKVLQWMPRNDYEYITTACDVGMIFLDHRFTIPNFPSRLLGYMQAGLPVLTVTDSNTDIGRVVEEGGFGWWCESNDSKMFLKKIDQILDMDLNDMKKKGFQYLKEHYNVEDVYKTIVDKV